MSELLNDGIGPHFTLPNGFVSWFETYFQFASYIQNYLENNVYPVEESKLPKNEIIQYYHSGGQADLSHLCRKWTDEFEEKYKGNDWVDKDWYDEIDELFNSKLNEKDN